ncbi:ABC transporter permease subunit [Salmonella enterica subsp. enterica serovar Montevideo]|nr:ABC transporter permease subunit [Salmonella enterica subsp. enterica serovar Montevideo]ECI2350373.1 ABC transporter permease subunit [Salmonella enterica subsp. enterica serovar Montevideo]
MIEIIEEYWKSLLWTDGYRFTGVAITLWLLISSVVMGGLLAVILAVGRVSSNKFIRFPIWLFTYIFRGTPLYVQLLVFYSGMYTLEIVKGTDLLNAFFRSGLNCTVLALTLNTCAYTTEIFAGAIRSVPDLLKIARDINSATYQPFTAFGIAAVLYLLISYVLISLFRRAERRWLQHVSSK